MQHTQLNVVIKSGLLLALLAAAPLVARAQVARPDPILGSGDLLNPKEGACADLAAGPDYAAGTNADGQPVAPADVGAGPVPVPDGISIPLNQQQLRGPRNGSPYGSAYSQRGRNPVTGGGGEGAYVQMDGRRLAPLLNPPACRK